MSIKKRNLHPSLVQWIMTQTGLGPGIGEIQYVAPAASATSQYRTQLQSMGVDPIEETIAAAEAKMVTSRNDVMLVAPGAYLVTAELEWDKSQTHLLGLGGPNQKHCPTTATEGAIQIKNVTTSIDSIFSVSGNYCQFHNIQTMNTFSHNANRADFIIGGKNTYMKGVRPRGGNGANQLNHADGGVPLIFEASSGNGFLAEDCFFGSAGNNARTVGPGAVLFEASAGSFAPVFRRCTFEMRCETNTSTPKLIHLAGDYSLDRYLLFDDCFFYNFWNNLAGKPPTAIVDACATTHAIVLKNCSQFGFDAWCDVATYCFTTSPIANTDGGEALAVATT